MKRILLCDDDHLMRETMGTYLSWYGFEVDGANQYFEVLSRLNKVPYDLLICNVWQKFLDGFELCNILRHSREMRIRNLPVLMISPEPLDHEDYKFLRERNVYFMMKYKSPDKWYEEIMAIFGQEISGVVKG
ncbi:MAG: response regulator [Candidatus Omnitrophica bacterium]|nr:response regulator [Candidatus Omnitrophota bacterium]MDD5670603.1 response regulator [Candidatus Omnitrophota bacterium]